MSFFRKLTFFCEVSMNEKAKGLWLDNKILISLFIFFSHILWVSLEISNLPSGFIHCTVKSSVYPIILIGLDSTIYCFSPKDDRGFDNLICYMREACYETDELHWYISISYYFFWLQQAIFFHQNGNILLSSI